MVISVFVLLVGLFWVLGFWGFFVCLFFNLSFISEGAKRRKKFQAAKFTLLSRFGFIFENNDKGRRAMVTPIRYYPSTKIASNKDRYAKYTR